MHRLTEARIARDAPHRRRRRRLLPLVILAIAGGCDSDSGGAQRVRVTFAVETPATALEEIAAEVSYPSFATLDTEAQPTCRTSPFVSGSSFFDSGGAVLAVSLTADDGFPPIGDCDGNLDGIGEDDGVCCYGGAEVDDPDCEDDSDDGSNGDEADDDDGESEDDDDDLAYVADVPGHSGGQDLAPDHGRVDSAAADTSPLYLFDCTWVVTRSAATRDFEASVTRAVGVDGLDLSPRPAIITAEVERMDEESPSDTDAPVRRYDVYLGVTNDAGHLGALQFDAHYLGVGGGWVGAAGSTRCTTLVEGALSTFNNRGNGTLSGALIDLDGIPTPGEVVRCGFATRENVGTGHFVVEVVDYADVEGKPISPSPAMDVTRIEDTR